MDHDKLYQLILKKIRENNLTPQKILLKNVNSSGQFSGHRKEIMDLVCDLVNRRVDVRQNEEWKSIPIFRHVDLKESEARNFDLEVILDESVLEQMQSGDFLSGQQG